MAQTGSLIKSLFSAFSNDQNNCIIELRDAPTPIHFTMFAKNKLKKFSNQFLFKNFVFYLLGFPNNDSIFRT